MGDSSKQISPAPQAFASELMIWLSPAFPVGGFAYSQGLETAVSLGKVSSTDTLRDWLAAVMRHGALRNDLILISLVMTASNDEALDELYELSAALQPSRERAQEALDLGRSFQAAYRAGWQQRSDVNDGTTETDKPVTLPCALAMAARAYRFTPDMVLEAYSIAFVSNLLSAAIRLGVVGQYDAQRIQADVLSDLRQVCRGADRMTLDDLGTATFGADLMSMLHETQTTRIFRS